MSELKPMYKTQEVADILNISRQMVWKLIKQGELKAIEVGRVYRIDHDELKRYMQRRHIVW